MLAIILLAILAADGRAGPKAPDDLRPSKAGFVRGYYERALAEHTRGAYRAFLRGKEFAGEFLGEFRLRWDRWRENEPGLPPEVFAAYAYYVRTINDEDLGAVRIYSVPIAGAITYAIRATTDGDAGWLELYDGSGRLLGAGRTYIEITAWGDRASIRAQTNNAGELPPALRDASKRTLWGK